MKQKLLLKVMLLLCALVAGSSSVWAATESVTFSAQGYTNGEDISSYDGTNFTISFNKGTNSSTPKYYTTGAAIRAYAGNTFTVSSTCTITAIALTFGSGDGSNEITTDVGTYSENSWTGSANSVTFTIGGTSGHRRLASVTVTYTPVAKTDPTITFNNGNVRVGKTLDVSSLFTSNSPGAVTYSITAGDSYASITGSTLTGVAEGNVTVQASQAETSAYNAKTATATISVVDPALSSIAITTAPTKTTYDEGEVFDATGAVVTATFADASTEDVTASCTWSPSGTLTTSDTEVTVSYTYKGVTKTATQAITVNPYVQPLSVTIDMNYTWLGSAKGKNLAAGVLPVVKNDDHVTTTITDGTSTRPRGDDTYIRVYTGSTITFAAPLGYCIKQLVFTTESTWNSPKASNGTLSSKTWTGKAPSVTFYLSGSCFINSVAVTLEAATAINIDITAANWASFSSAYEVEIPTGVTAYYAQQKDAENVTLKEITDGYIPANTGVVVYSATAKTYTANITTTGATLGETNILKPWVTAGMPGDATYYTLAAGPTFKKSSGGILAAGKAYLVMPAAAAPELGVDFGGTTGINAVNGSEFKVNGEYYNLAGQRVANPTKGLYIVNGKKVIIK